MNPDVLKLNLNDVIEGVEKHLSDYLIDPAKNFTRKRKLDFSTIMSLLIGMGGNTISKELWNYFGYSTTTVSASAFVQQRSKIKYQAIEDVFHSFVNKCDRQSLYKGYRLLAVDGSDVRLPTDKREVFTYLANDDTSEGYNLLHLDAMYDILQHIYVDASLQSKIGMNEHNALVSMIDRSKIQDKAIIIADRGYESFNNIAHCQEKNWSYIIRSKESYGIKYTSPHTEEYDIDVMITLTRRQTKETHKLIKENPERYRWIQPHTTFDYIQPKSDTMYDLPIRIVRFKLSDTSYETIFTNLSREEFSADVLKELYHLRWGIETSFKELKYNVGLINFHSKKIEFIFQEIYAKLIMYNFSASIVYDQPTVQNKRINFSKSITLCYEFFKEKLSSNTLLEMLIKLISSIRSNRTFERKKKPKSAISFAYRVS
jgi:hypothetical protein